MAVRYRFIRELVWEILLDLSITALPINVFDIATRTNSHLISIEKNEDLLKHIGIFDDSICNEAFCTVFNGKKLIFFRSQCDNKERLNFSIAHEIGHLELGHCFSGSDDVDAEVEANYFAASLLMPACFLYESKLIETQDIASACNVSLQCAKVRSERMKVLLSKGMFYSHPLERLLRQTIAEYMDS